MRSYRILPFLSFLVCLSVLFSAVPEPVVLMDGEQADGDVDGIKGQGLKLSPSGKSSFVQVSMPSGLSFEKGQPFTVSLWVQTTVSSADYPAIIANKDWNSGEIKDFTTQHEFGFSRTSGANKGWAILMQPDGAWAWNIGNGRYRLDYRPTPKRQKINDGRWHHLAFSINPARAEARLYFDGTNVAIYHLGGAVDLNSGLPVCIGADGCADQSARFFEGAADEVAIYDRVLTDADIRKMYQQCRPSKQVTKKVQRVKELKLLAWNIWHGGRHPGREIGPQQVIDFIKATEADIVMMQETYGSGPIIADALGYYFYLASTNLSVMSRYPIHETWTVHNSFNCGVTGIELSPGQRIVLSSLWIHYLPAWRRDARAEGATAAALIAGEGKTRHREIKHILELLKPQIDLAGEVPVIIGGDFNSPSHLDWVELTKDWHNGLAVEWPVSKEMQNAGFMDSFRTYRPDLNYASDTITAERLTYRIDYIYFKGKGLRVTDSDMYRQHNGTWPSDHPAVSATLELP